MNERTWIFFIEDVMGNVVNIEKRSCIKPSRTKQWKKMQTWLSNNPFNNFDLEKVGYRVFNPNLDDSLKYLNFTVQN